MNSTGILRKVDELGQVVLPIELRKRFDIKEKDYFEIFTEDDTIILKKCTPRCSFCDKPSETIRIKGKLICRDCLETIREAGR